MADLKLHLTDGRTCTVSNAGASGTIGSVVEAFLAGQQGVFTVTVDDTVRQFHVQDLAGIEVVR
ncbi:hypothetical protein [Dactylosporangium sp. CA-139066]|uniref:hypothetical protein n=1 Tax=Dactylosporangium sp. CA-139066 TaxID=3239930 RepID=UPI003D8ECF28